MTIRASRMRVESSTSEAKAVSLCSSGPLAGHPKPIHTRSFLPGLSLRSIAME
jgi:hypothetical protein